MAEIRLKPGATLLWNVVDDGGDLTGTTITAAVATPRAPYGDRGEFSYTLTVTETDLSAGEYTISAADTSTFPPGPLDCDIKYSVGGVVTYSDTFRIYVDKKVTA